MESKSKKPSDAAENNANTDLYKCLIQQALAVSTINIADEPLAAAKSASKTQISVKRCLCDENSMKRSLRHVSFTRGSPRIIDSKKSYERSSFSVVAEDTQLNPKGCLYFDDLDDLDFYPTDVSSEMLQRDQEDHERTMADLDCCLCSSSSVCSKNDVSQISLHLDSDSPQSMKKRVSVDEFIRVRTEYLGSPSDDLFRQRPYFESDVVLPFPKKLFSSTPAKKSAGLEIEKKKSASDENAKWSEKKLRGKSDVHFLQNVNESSGFSEWETTVIQSSLSMTSQMKESLVSSQNYFTCDNSQDLCREATELWTVQPQELTIDINSKGARILLINESTQDLKFKTKFDGQIINVCPVSGILPAKDQMRMRILVSAFIKRVNENAVDIITVTCGKTKKNVSIKVCKRRQPISTIKARTYICF